MLTIRCVPTVALVCILRVACKCLDITTLTLEKQALNVDDDGLYGKIQAVYIATHIITYY